jgi:hypothetical protein
MDLEETEARNDWAGEGQQQLTDQPTKSLETHMEARSNISTVALRIIGGKEKWNPVPGGITGPPISWEI